MTEEAKPPKIDVEGNWKVEYEQLSEDFRHLRTVGWQVAFAALAADGVLLGAIPSLLDRGLIGGLASAFLLIVGGLFSVIMGLEIVKWVKRGSVRVKRLEEYDKLAEFGRYFPRETGLLTWPTGTWLARLIASVGLILLIASLFVIGFSIAPYVHLSA